MCFCTHSRKDKQELYLHFNTASLLTSQTLPRNNQIKWHSKWIDLKCVHVSGHRIEVYPVHKGFHQISVHMSIIQSYLQSLYFIYEKNSRTNKLRLIGAQKPDHLFLHSLSLLRDLFIKHLQCKWWPTNLLTSKNVFQNEHETNIREGFCHPNESNHIKIYVKVLLTPNSVFVRILPAAEQEHTVHRCTKRESLTKKIVAVEAIHLFD